MWFPKASFLVSSTLNFRHALGQMFVYLVFGDRIIMEKRGMLVNGERGVGEV